MILNMYEQAHCKETKIYFQPAITYGKNGMGCLAHASGWKRMALIGVVSQIDAA